MPNVSAQRALYSTMQLGHALTASHDNENAKLRVAGGVVTFSSKAPGLKSAFLGRSAKLKEVKHFMENISNNFQSNVTPALATPLQIANRRASLTRDVRSQAARVASLADQAIKSGGDVLRGQCNALNDAIAAAVDPNGPSDFNE